MINLDTPGHISQLLRHLTDNGYPAFLVGGCVRDAVMGRPVNDWDVATAATPVDIARLFPKTFLTGEKFGTVTVLTPEDQVEVTTFRTEGAYYDGRRPAHVEFVSSLEEDLSRRDFTINAMAMSSDGELVDPFGGIKDIENRVIRCVGGPNTRFSEDSLRMFRAFRFSAQLGFDIEQETLLAIYANANRAKLISTERIRVELEKTLMSHKPEIAGEMVKIGLMSRYVASVGRNPADLERIAKLPMESAIRWCAFCAILARERLIGSAAEFLRDVRLDGKTIRTCLRALSITDFPDDSIGIKALCAKCGVDSVRCAAAASEAINGGSALQRVGEIIASGECFSLNKLAVTGSDLIAAGHPPGRELGLSLEKLLAHVIERPEDNVREALLELAARWSQSPLFKEGGA